MNTQFAHDLCAARRKAGLSQRDLCILLEVGSRDIAALEEGIVQPTIEQLCRLSIIYKLSFTQHYEGLMRAAREALFRSLPDLPECSGDPKAEFNRDNTLKRLDRDLTAALTQKNAAD